MADSKVRVSAVQATQMVNQMRANHGLGIMETYVLGQGYIAGALLASMVKNNDRIIEIFRKHGDEIRSEVLAEEVTVGETSGYEKEWNINSEHVTLSVERLS